MDSTLESLQKSVKSLTQKYITLAKHIAKYDFWRKVGAKDSFKVAAVDGSVVKKSFYGFEVYALRAVGVFYEIENGKLKKVEYWPSRNVKPSIKVSTSLLDEFQSEAMISIERSLEEIKTAKEVVERFKPNAVLLDGSIIPHYLEFASNYEELRGSYRDLIDAHKQLFKASIETGTLLAGVIKDSRGRRFLDYVMGKVTLPLEIVDFANHAKDSVVLNYSMNENERTVTFNYSSNPFQHPILQHFPEFAESVKSFYLKNTRFDLPLRVDFLSHSDSEEEANEISGIILALTNNQFYAVPSILIEVDQRARISKDFLKPYVSFLTSKIGVPFELRNDRRPF